VASSPHGAVIVLKNYIILAHRNPSHLSRLIKRLDDGSSLFFVHLDKRVEMEPFANAIPHEKVKFIDERVVVIWADFSLVQATLNLMQTALETGNGGFTILLSGVDYPIKSNRSINEFLERCKDMNFITIFSMKPGDRVYDDIFCHTKINKSDGRGDFELIPCKPESKIACLDNTFLKGGTWLALNFDTLKKTLDFVRENWACLDEYYRNRAYSDEIFFQAIVSHLSRRDKTIRMRRSLTYTDWKPKTEGESLPRTFGKDDLEVLLSRSEGKLFARKFDGEYSPYSEEVLNFLDRHISE
jgi:hypothetical protein